jgi:hypothetical protein
LKNSNLLPKLIVLIFVALTGCAVPKELKPIVAGEGGKVQLLQEAITMVHKSVQWGDPTIAYESVSPKIFPMFYQKMVGNPKTVRVLEVSSTGVEMDSVDPNKATSTVEIQVYGAPTYSVRTVSKKESWEFSRMDGGWRLVSVEDAPDAPAPS